MNLLIVEDQLFIQNSITDLLFYTRKDISLSFEINPYNAIKHLNNNKLKYDFVISDLQFENGSKSFDVIDYCYKNNIKVLVFSMFENPIIVKMAMNKGAMGYFSKYDDLDVTINGFIKVFESETFISPRVKIEFDKVDNNWEPFPLKLTNAERNILYCLARGMTMLEISKKYNIQDNTLRAHRRNMMQKNKCTYEKLLSCFNLFPPQIPFDDSFGN